MIKTGLTAILLLFSMAVHAQGTHLADARDAYWDAYFDKAIDLFSAISMDASADAATREEAWLYLSRSHVAKGETPEAREALKTLLQMDPAYDLDPDKETLALMELYYELRKEIKGNYEVEMAPRMRTLAILDFTNSSIDEKERFDPMQQGFASMMINYLNNSIDLKVVERERIQWLLKELEMQRDETIVDQSEAVRPGKLLGAHAVLMGAFTIMDDDIWISARLVNVETSEIMLSEQKFGRTRNLFEIVKDLSNQVAVAFNSNPPEKAELDSENLDATISYAEGVKKLDQGDYQAAYEKFQEALAYDSDFARAQIKAESIKPMLMLASNVERGSNSGQ